MNFSELTVNLSVLLTFGLFLKDTVALKWLAFRFNENHSWTRRDCGSAYFNNRLKRFCNRHTQLMQFFPESIYLTKAECKQQFKDRRWNCSTIERAPYFAVDLKEDTRESSFVHALFSASLVFSVSYACMTGKLEGCSCARKPTYLAKGKSIKQLRFSSCTNFMSQGLQYAHRFAESAWKRKKKVVVGNDVKLHNSRVGRMAIQSLQTIDCRCHGVSGACAHKSCWKRLPEFPKVAKKILQKYDNAVKVTYERSTRSFKPAYYDVTSVRPDHLIYGYNSPNYCDRNEKLGVLGTAGRQCNSTSLGHDHCTLLCCGRGVNIKRVELVERCRCKYYWCCYVKCKQCKRTVDQYTCK